jgi:hypothetical protein
MQLLQKADENAHAGRNEKIFLNFLKILALNEIGR